jgi:hypothetical protein
MGRLAETHTLHGSDSARVISLQPFLQGYAIMNGGKETNRVPTVTYYVHSMHGTQDDLRGASHTVTEPQ